MKRSSIYNLGKFSFKQLETFKQDILNHSIQNALKIKNLSFTEEQITKIVNNAIESVFLRYDSKNGEILGDMIKTQVFADLRAEFSKMYPTKVNRVKWPDLAQKKAAEHLLEVVRKLQEAPKVKADKILSKTNEELKGRQQQILSTMMSMERSITYVELMSKFEVAIGTIAKDVQFIYKTLMNSIEILGIEL